jgi:hypothetical protein
MNTTTESAVPHGVRSEEMYLETESVILDRFASFDEDVKTAVDAREALIGIRRNLKRVSTP